MSFQSCTFSFDGIPCTEFGLQLYNVGSSNSQENSVSFTSVGELVGTHVSGRYDTYLHGIDYTEPLQFSMTFGANIDSVDNMQPMERFEIAAISSWLTGHSTYKWLEIHQPDMVNYRYKCIITELSLITYGNNPWAFECVVTCDSPYAYMYPETKTYEINNSAEITFLNKGTHNQYYYPTLSISNLTSNSFSIINHSDNDREFSFTGIPLSSGLVININNDKQIITNTENLNFYEYFNKKFLRLLRGDNKLTINGNLTVSFTCEFPVNIGG